MGKLASSYTSFDDLLAGVMDGIQETLNTVAPQLESKLQQSAEKNIHPKNPRSNGITSVSNIVSSVSRGDNSFMVVVKDIAKPQGPRWGEFRESDDAAVGGTMFASWIENAGSDGFMGWMDLKHYLDTGEKQARPARPFIAPAQVNAVLLIQAALKGL